MACNRANWDEATTKTLLDLCIAEKNQFNWSNRCLTKLGWKHVYRSFNQQTGMNLGSKAFLSWKDLQSQSSLGRDKQTGGIAADASFWDDDEGETSAGAAQPSSVKSLPFLDELYTLYGYDTQDRGTLLTAGGIREVTPSVGTEANAHAHNLSKRPSREISVDSPPKKKSGSLEDYVRDLSETVATRSQKRGDREQEELDRAMQLIEEDGLQEGSELYCQALYLCRNSMYRRTFTKMKMKEGRLNWIQFNWDRENK
uniref:Myb/SANT-like domain-containing protein n=1 Tax=Setaria italica TaxID=4555 RepID=K3ZME6_SETIT